jgi:hypothetical protein
MTTPPTEIEDGPSRNMEGDASGTIPIDTALASGRTESAWANEEWVTAKVPVFVAPMEVDQEQDIVAALVTTLDGDHVRIQRVVDALIELMRTER